MKIMVASTWRPFARGEPEHLAETLGRELAARGHEAMLVKLPEPGESGLQQLLAFRSLHLLRADRVVALQPAACAVLHPDKVAWLVQAGAGYGSHLRECARIYAASAAVAASLKQYHGIDAPVLEPALGWERVVAALAA